MTPDYVVVRKEWTTCDTSSTMSAPHGRDSETLKKYHSKMSFDDHRTG